jgi:leucyl-tRNA synthetase
MTFKWPKYDESLAKEDTISLPVQVNGKLRATIQVTADIEQDEAVKLAKQESNVAKFLEGKKVVKEIFVPGRIVNIVVRE